jgi:uncharacterized membrane protein
MDENGGFFGPMMRHGGAIGQHAQDAGTSSVEWAILGLTIAILVLVVLILVDSCRRRRHHLDSGWDRTGEPLEIVRMRYSRGELSREQYLQTLEDLGAPPEQKPAPAPPTEGAGPPRRRGRRKLP